MPVLSEPEMLQRTTTSQIDHDSELPGTAQSVSKISITTSTIPSNIVMELKSSEIWVGFTKNGCHYIDKRPKAPNSEQQIYALQQYYHTIFSATERFVLRWMYCQIPIVRVGTTHGTLTTAPENDIFPHAIHFDSLEKHRVLSTGFYRPDILRESGDIFHSTDEFDIKSMSAIAKRSVLCIGHAVDKKLLLWPLSLTCSTAATVAVVVGETTRSVAAGAEVGSFVGVLFGLIWAYVMWLSG